MNRKRFQIGDLVRIIPPSYTDIFKSDYHQLNHRHEANSETNETVMLGGLYRIRGFVSRGGSTLAEVLANPKYSGQVPLDYLVGVESVKLCPFELGDCVVFQPPISKSDRNELREMRTAVPLDEESEHEVTRILNSYYIEIDHDSAVYRWEDFRPVLRSP